MSAAAARRLGGLAAATASVGTFTWSVFSPFFRQPKRDFDVAFEATNSIRACVTSIQGLRSTQEDAHSISCELPEHPDLSFFAIYDGHRGDVVSHFASNEVLRQFSNLLPGHADNENYSPDTIQDVLRKALMQTDQALEALEDGEGRQRFMYEGSTALVCVTTPDHVVCANVGDSRALLLTVHAHVETADKVESSSQVEVSITPLSEDQKPNGKQEQQRIRKAGMDIEYSNGAWRINNDLAVPRALGDFRFKDKNLPQEEQGVSCEPAFIAVPRSTADGEAQVLCLGCDGVWDVVANEEAATVIAQELSKGGGSLFTSASNLVLHALEKGSRDNISVLLADISKPRAQFPIGEVPK